MTRIYSLQPNPMPLPDRLPSPASHTRVGQNAERPRQRLQRAQLPQMLRRVRVLANAAVSAGCRMVDAADGRTHQERIHERCWETKKILQISSLLLDPHFALALGATQMSVSIIERMIARIKAACSRRTSESPETRVVAHRRATATTARGRGRRRGRPPGSRCARPCTTARGR